MRPERTIFNRKPHNFAPSNGTPWYKTCAAKAAGGFLLHGSIDALGVIPGEAAVAFGGKEAFEAIQFGSGLASTAWSLSDSSQIGQVGTGFGMAGAAVGLASRPGSLKSLASIAGTSVKSVAELIPGIGQAVAIGSVLWDGVTALQEYAECSERQH